VVLGLDFGGSKIAAAVADESGVRLSATTVATDPGRGGRWNLDRGVEAARALVAETVPDGELVAVGACTFGIPAAHGIRLAPAIPGWGDLSLSLELAEAFGTRAVRVATDVKAAAAAEAASGALVGHDPAIYLNLGTGLAVAIVCGGKVVSGANGGAGEIGYSLRQVGDVELARADRIVLEEVVSGMAIAAAGSRRTGREVTAEDVFANELTDPRLDGALDDFVRELSFHLVNLAVAVDPSRIAVGGGMVRSWHRIQPQLRKALDANVPFPPELVVGEYPFDAALVGAVRLGVEAAVALTADSRPEVANGRAVSETDRPRRRSISSQDTDRSEDRGRV